MKYEQLIFWLLLIFCLSFPPNANAAMCRARDSHSVCIFKLKRSAKYHWEYRATVSIDGQKKTQEIYNCRDRTVARKNKFPIPFKSDLTGELVCSLFQK
jgi:hypothetical protein